MTEILIEIRKKGIMELLSSWPVRNSTVWTSFIIVIGLVLLLCTSFKTKHYGNYSFFTEKKRIISSIKYQFCLCVYLFLLRSHSVEDAELTVNILFDQIKETKERIGNSTNSKGSILTI